MHALLTSLGFECQLGVATMLVVPDLPPNHGTVLVTLGSPTVPRGRLHAPWRTPAAGGWRGNGNPASRHRVSAAPTGRDAGTCGGVRSHQVDGFECRLEHFDATPEEYRERYEQTRGGVRSITRFQPGATGEHRHRGCLRTPVTLRPDGSVPGTGGPCGTQPNPDRSDRHPGGVGRLPARRHSPAAASRFEDRTGGVGELLNRFRRLDEGRHLSGSLPSRGQFDAAGHIDGVGTHPPHRLLHIVGFQSLANTSGPALAGRNRQLPVKPSTRAAMGTRRPRIEQVGIHGIAITFQRSFNVSGPRTRRPS